MRSLIPSLAVLALAVPVAPVAAQGSAVSGLSAAYHAVHGFVVGAAEAMPEANYSFKPTPEVRSFGQLVGHIANANYLFCSTATGEQSPNAEDFEKVTDKAPLVAAVKASFDYCTKAHGMSDAKGVESISLFGMAMNRLGVLAFNTAHDYEHYGNIVTYMRLKGLVPPSSHR